MQRNRIITSLDRFNGPWLATCHSKMGNLRMSRLCNSVRQEKPWKWLLTDGELGICLLVCPNFCWAQGKFVDCKGLASRERSESHSNPHGGLRLPGLGRLGDGNRRAGHVYRA